MRHGRKRRSSSFDNPYVAYAVIGGIVIVIIIALVFYLGGGSSPAVTAKTSPSGTPASDKSSSATGSGKITTGVAPSVIPTQTPVVVPVTGVYLKVNYLGGFAGMYQENGVSTIIRDSGTRLYPIENATTGTLTAAIHKQDGSTTHELDVEIWKNGKAITFGKNQSSFGIVRISAAI